MDKKLLAIILGVLVGSLITSPTFSFAQKETDSDKPEADCDAYENDKNKLSEENKKVIVIGLVYLDLLPLIIYIAKDTM